MAHEMEFAALLAQARQADGELRGAVVNGQTIVQTDGTQVEFVKVTFRSCQFVQVSFTGASFYECTFESCRFEGCDFSRTYWRDCTLEACKSDGGLFTKCKMKSVCFRSCRMRYANFALSSWTRCTLCGGSFRETGFAQMQLEKTTVSGVDFTGAEFYQTPLAGIDFSDSILEGIVLSEGCKELRGAKISAMQAAAIVRLLGVQVL